MGGGSGSGARSAGPHRRPLPPALLPSSLLRLSRLFSHFYKYLQVPYRNGSGSGAAPIR